MIFKSKSHSTSGFDTLIGANVALHDVLLRIAADTTIIIDGTVSFKEIQAASSKGKTTVVVNGSLTSPNPGEFRIDNIVVSGTLECDVLIVDGELSVKAGSKLIANQIKYNKLIIEPSAIITGHLQPISSTTE